MSLSIFEAPLLLGSVAKRFITNEPFDLKLFSDFESRLPKVLLGLLLVSQLNPFFLPNAKALSLPPEKVGKSESDLAGLRSFAKELVLDNGEFSLEPNIKSSGTSVYPKLIHIPSGRVIGAIIPHNSANDEVGEILAYNIARYLGFSELYQPAAAVKLVDNNYSLYKSKILSANYSKKTEGVACRNEFTLRIKSKNQPSENGEKSSQAAYFDQCSQAQADGKKSGGLSSTLDNCLLSCYKTFKVPNKAQNYADITGLNGLFENNPSELWTVLKLFDQRPLEIDVNMTKRENLNLDYKFSGSSHSVGELLSCTGPHPTSDVVSITISGGKGVPTKGTGREVDFMRELSNIFIVDILTGQWDRFSGGNLEAIFLAPVDRPNSDQNIHLVAFDNGGTWSSGSAKKYFSFTTRFDKIVADKVLKLNSDLKSGEFEAQLRSQLDFSSSKFDGKWSKFKSNLRALVNHLQSYQNCYF